MKDNKATSLERARQGFKFFNRAMILFWRLGLGRWVNVAPRASGQIMVLTHTGRKSGRTYRQPLNYALVDGELYCVAGFGAGSDWYKNILADPRVQVWLPDEWWQGEARDCSAEPNRVQLIREVLIGSGFAAYAAGLHPHAMSDAELDVVTQSYRLIHIQRLSPRTGRDGPGDLAWVWQVTTVALLAIVLGTRRYGRR
jgi:deazaflavin-dependent oxidoreductase (nitroreductase family)